MKGWIIFFAVIGICAFAGAYATGSYFGNLYVIEGTVKKKMLSPSDDGTTYVIILEDNRKLEILRNFVYGGPEYNEDVIYASIEEGKRYRFTCWGWELDFWTIYYYPNVIKAEPIP